MNKTKKVILHIAYTSILSALIFVVTFFIPIPYGGGQGYFNFSDAIILFSTIFFGPFEGIIAGIIGTAMADIALGYFAFAPFTILAKGLEAVACFVIFYLLREHKYLKFVSLFIAPLFMIFTYFISYYVFYGIEGCFTSVFDIIQGYSGSIIALMLYSIFCKIKIPNKLNFYKIGEKNGTTN